MLREIKRIVKGRAAVDGAGVRLTRVFGHGDTEDFDPFLMLDAFDSKNPADYLPGFPMHPHRGMETITYLLEGRIEHRDSLGHHGLIESGDCQWMTAGGGILHQEMPLESPRFWGLQLWLNLPAAHKMAPPKYHGLTAAELPWVEETGAKIVILAGGYREHDGAMRGEHVDARFLDAAIQPNAVWTLDTRPEDTVFVYLFSGSAALGAEGRAATARQAVLFGPGDQLTLQAGPEGARLAVLSGAPLKEPIAWGGPIVMNTQDELQEAARDLARGDFARAGRRP